MERLQKVIAQSGIASRRKAEELIQKGLVFVNGKCVRELGTKVSPKDKIEVDGKEIMKEKKVYFLLNKPRGVVTTTSDEKMRKTVVDLIECEERIYPVGRLDYDTTGVLLLTNDGEFANILMHPSHGVLKVYVAKLRGIIKGEEINTLKNGVLIGKEKVYPKRVKLKKVDAKTQSSYVEITIQEGKNHEVKELFKSVGFEVEKLTRERYGFFDTKGLKSGEYRPLNPKEVSKVYGMK